MPSTLAGINYRQQPKKLKKLKTKTTTEEQWIEELSELKLNSWEITFVKHLQDQQKLTICQRAKLTEIAGRRLNRTYSKTAPNNTRAVCTG